MATAAAEHQCLFWDISFGPLFYTGNALIGAGFVIPQSYAYSLVAYRAVMVVGRYLVVMVGCPHIGLINPTY